jgi:TRAP-type C4-dicarboxylate transport system permease small subunit
MAKKRSNKAERVFRFLGSLLDRITHLSWLFSGALIVLMAFVTGYGVVMRYIFKNPDPYAYEISYICMLGCVVFSIAQTQRLGRHLRIDIFDRYFSERVRGIILNIVSPIVGLILCIPLVWKTWEQAWFALQTGQTTATTGLPTFPMMVAIPVGVGLLCLVLIAQILSYIFSSNKEKRRKREETDGVL